jgi:hypothetical protein
VRYVEDMKKATLAEFDQEEAEWRETAEGQVLNLCEIVDPLPTSEVLDKLDNQTNQDRGREQHAALRCR